MYMLGILNSWKFPRQAVHANLRPRTKTFSFKTLFCITDSFQQPILLKTFQNQASALTRGAILMHEVLHSKLNSFHPISNGTITWVFRNRFPCSGFIIQSHLRVTRD